MNEGRRFRKIFFVCTAAETQSTSTIGLYPPLYTYPEEPRHHPFVVHASLSAQQTDTPVALYSNKLGGDLGAVRVVALPFGNRKTESIYQAKVNRGLPQRAHLLCVRETSGAETMVVYD